jgi:hypothetical protein
VCRKIPLPFQNSNCFTVVMSTCYMTPIQSHINPLLQLTSHFIKKKFTIILPTTTLSSKFSLSLWFPTKTHNAFPFYPTHSTFSIYPFLRDFTTRIVGQYKSRSSTFYSSSYTKLSRDYAYLSPICRTAVGIYMWSGRN